MYKEYDEDHNGVLEYHVSMWRQRSSGCTRGSLTTSLCVSDCTQEFEHLLNKCTPEIVPAQ